MAKLSTSDLHFGHVNILKFTQRYHHMFEDSCFEKQYFIDPDIFERMHGGTMTPSDKEYVKEKHDNWLIERLNSRIENGDVVYHVGDFAFYKDLGKIREIIMQLAGDWIFILGNHDNESALREACKGTRHKVVGAYHEAHVNRKRVIFCHYPIEEWNQCHNGSWHVYGHLHGSDGHGEFKIRKDLPRRFDTGIDAHPNCMLFNLDEVIK